MNRVLYDLKKTCSEFKSVKISGPNGKEAKGRRGTLHNEEFNNFTLRHS
jgi:hypothetical protein